MPCCIICSNICFSSLVKSHFPIAVGRSCRARPSAAPARGRVTDLHPSSCETAASSPRPSPHAGQGRLLSSRAFGLPAALPLTAVPLRNPSLLRRELSALCPRRWAAPAPALALVRRGSCRRRSGSRDRPSERARSVYCHGHLVPRSETIRARTGCTLCRQRSRRGPRPRVSLPACPSTCLSHRRPSRGLSSGGPESHLLPNLPAPSVPRRR